MKEKQIVILKPIDKEKGFCIDDKLYNECLKRIGIENKKRDIDPFVFITKETIAFIISAFLDRYQNKKINK
jgi:hypothetical protein